ncbi:MAG: alpha/beta fold hydrolase [Acidimicrobiales bacterium]
MRLHTHEWGDRDAPPVVCLHGVGAHGGRFARLASRLPDFRFVAFDLRGHGRSPFEPPWTIATHLSDVLESTEAAGISEAAWLGHSFGGRLVLELAARRAGLIEKLILLDPGIRLRPDIALALADAARIEQVFATESEAVPPRFGGSLFRTPSEMLADEREEHLEPSPTGFRWRFSPSAVVAILGELATWPPPPEDLHERVLMILGSDESVVGPRQLERYRRSLRERLDVVHVPGGHVVLWDAFEETLDAVRSFLGSPSRDSDPT